MPQTSLVHSISILLYTFPSPSPQSRHTTFQQVIFSRQFLLVWQLFTRQALLVCPLFTSQALLVCPLFTRQALLVCPLFTRKALLVWPLFTRQALLVCPWFMYSYSSLTFNTSYTLYHKGTNPSTNQFQSFFQQRTEKEERKLNRGKD